MLSLNWSNPDHREYMNQIVGHIIRALLISGVVLIAISAYCFWHAYRIKQVLIERAGDDPFAMVLIDEPQPTVGGQENEVQILNHRRRADEKTGRILLVGGMIFSSVGAVARARTRRPQTLGLSD